MKHTLTIILACICLSCKQQPKQSEPHFAPIKKSLKEVFKDKFDIGVAINPADLKDSGLITTQFNSLTFKQDMQPMRTHKGYERWSFGTADSLLLFAERNNMKVRGHCLIYNIHMNKWFFRDKVGNFLPKDKLIERVKKHVATQVSHFKGKVYCWDVVNEALRTNDTLLQLTGNEEYIYEAFKAARQSDPAAKLFYNDGVYDDRSFDKVYSLLQRIKSNAPIDGIGWQLHIGADGFDEAAYQRYLDAFSSLGLLVHITELDISIFPRRSKAADVSGSNDEFTQDVSKKQAVVYGNLFRFFKKNKDKISSVTIWGLADNTGNNTFLNNTLKKRNYPYLFKDSNKAKESFEAVIN